MPINEESKQAYLESREVFVESYKDFLRKLLGLLYDAEAADEFAHARDDVTRFADEVKILQSHIDDYMTEEQRAGGSPSSSATPHGLSSQDEVERASSPGEQQELARQQPDDEESTPVPLLGTGGMQTTTSDQDQQKSTTSKSKESTHDSADEMQAEVESQPSQVSPEPADEAPVVLPPPLIDDGRVVSAFCAFRYHKAEFRQLFMRQGSNNNSCYSLALSNSSSSAVDSVEQSLLSPPPPVWVGPLAHCALRLMRSAFRDAKPGAWESLKRRLAGFGFKPEMHFALWLRLSSAAADTGAAGMDPVDVFNAIPPLASLPKRLAAETEVMLQTLNLLSQ